MHVACSADHRIDVTDLLEQRSNARRSPINPAVAMRPAGADNFVTAFELFDDGFADGAVGADHENFIVT